MDLFFTSCLRDGTAWISTNPIHRDTAAPHELRQNDKANNQSIVLFSYLSLHYACSVRSGTRSWRMSRTSVRKGMLAFCGTFHCSLFLTIRWNLKVLYFNKMDKFTERSNILSSSYHSARTLPALPLPLRIRRGNWQTSWNWNIKIYFDINLWMPLALHQVVIFRSGCVL